MTLVITYRESLEDQEKLQTVDKREVAEPPSATRHETVPNLYFF
jgi:hypothetical protein